ncbi:hypothetical protein ABZT17_36105 [Streptomyces sp. NPDC005648]|uniref:hypothetical protein n=1 Tax=Streptomyces sp. NPDC005648 TaxID=3157044 RepID=UPI0033AFFE2A
MRCSTPSPSNTVPDAVGVLIRNGRPPASAFLRRMDVTVDFVPPDAELRRRLWSAHLPGGHQVGPAVLSDIARRCDLTGGQIRNAALHAVLRALDSGTAVRDEDVVAAVRREYRRTGASCPLPIRTETGR